LGILVVVIATALLFSFVKGKGMIGSGSTDSSTAVNQEKVNSKIYEVKPGDDLWGIAEKEYGSGYNWVDVAAANKLANPDDISAGQKLIIPKVAKRSATDDLASNTDQAVLNAQVVEKKDNAPSQNAIAGKSYVVKEGDFLWDIAVRAYGDGYRWVDIAQANNLANPDLIFSENALKIPR